METIDIYNLIRTTQKETKREIHSKISKAYFFECRRDISKEKKWTKSQQDAYTKAFEVIMDIVINT